MTLCWPGCFFWSLLLNWCYEHCIFGASVFETREGWDAGSLTVTQLFKFTDDIYLILLKAAESTLRKQQVADAVFVAASLPFSNVHTLQLVSLKNCGKVLSWVLQLATGTAFLMSSVDQHTGKSFRSMWNWTNSGCCKVSFEWEISYGNLNDLFFLLKTLRWIFCSCLLLRKDSAG